MGALLAHLGVTDPGHDLPALRATDYVTDVLSVCAAERDEMEEFQAEMDQMRHRS